MAESVYDMNNERNCNHYGHEVTAAGTRHFPHTSLALVAAYRIVVWIAHGLAIPSSLSAAVLVENVATVPRNR